MTVSLASLRRRVFPWRLQLRACIGRRNLERIPLSLGFLAYTPSCVRAMSPLWDYARKNGVVPSYLWYNGTGDGGINGPGVLTHRRELLRFIDSCRAEGRWPVFIIALDSSATPEHAWGCGLVRYLRRLGATTICLQHGGTKLETIHHLAYSESEYIVAWGELVRDRLTGLRPELEGHVKVLGNPSHDFLKRENSSPVDAFPLLLATCLHSEYGDDVELYRRFLREVYAACAAAGVPLKVIRHPRDPRSPDLYRVVGASVHGLNFEVFDSSPQRYYELLAGCETVVTRASTAAEEALALGKRAIFYNFPERNLASDYSHLSECAQVHFCQHPDALSSLLAAPLPAWEQADASGLFSLFDGRCCERHFQFFRDVRTSRIDLPAQPE